MFPKPSADTLRRRLVPIVLAQALGFLCGVIGVHLVSAWVEPADYGAYGVFLSLATVGSGVIFAGLVKFITRHWAADDRPALLRAVAAASTRKTLWLVAAAVGVGLVVAPQRPVLYGGLFFASALLLAVAQLAQSALQAAREHWRDLGLTLAWSVSRSFFAPLLYVATAGGLTALLVGFSLHTLVPALLGIWSLSRWRSRAATPNTAAAASVPPLYDGSRFVVLALVAWILLGVNRWLVAWRFGNEAAGYFTLAANVGAILPMMLNAIFLQFFQPKWFVAPAETPGARAALARDVDRAALAFTGLALGVAWTVHVAMPVLVGTWVDERYAQAVPFVLAAGCAAVAATAGNFYHAMLLAARREPACTHVDLTGGGLLIMGSVVSALAGVEWFKRWLLVSPLVPWLVNRPLARRAVLDRSPRAAGVTD